MDSLKNILPQYVQERNIQIQGHDPVVAEGFVLVPKFIVKSRHLTQEEKLAYAMFLCYAWEKNYVFPGQAVLGKDMGVSERSVSRYIAGLREKGFISIKRRGQGRTNLYILRYLVKVRKIRKK